MRQYEHGYTTDNADGWRCTVNIGKLLWANICCGWRRSGNKRSVQRRRQVATRVG
ncbi:MAG: hypothetical protein R2795_09435 [Saprospiraceae bacterium]